MRSGFGRRLETGSRLPAGERDWTIAGGGRSGKRTRATPRETSFADDPTHPAQSSRARGDGEGSRAGALAWSIPTLDRPPRARSLGALRQPRDDRSRLRRSASDRATPLMAKGRTILIRGRHTRRPTSARAYGRHPEPAETARDLTQGRWLRQSQRSADHPARDPSALLRQPRDDRSRLRRSASDRATPPVATGRTILIRGRTTASDQHAHTAVIPSPRRRRGISRRVVGLVSCQRSTDHPARDPSACFAGLGMTKHTRPHAARRS